MTTEFVQYGLQDGVATIRIDDGKRNALSPEVLKQIYHALDRAESDRAIVIITGRESVFSAGFDLKVMKRGGMNALRMLRAGYGLTARVMAYPYPVIAACNGHVLAMGVFLMLSADYVIGSRGRIQDRGKRSGYRYDDAARCSSHVAASPQSGRLSAGDNPGSVF